MQTFRSDISNTEFSIVEKISAKTIRKNILHLIQKDCPTFSQASFLSINELANYKKRALAGYMQKEMDELSKDEAMVLSSLTNYNTITNKAESEDIEFLTIGQKISDKVAYFGGSWKFIICFGVFMFIWICFNVFWFANKRFDPYPFILLNLILSCLAALQAPVIMMSQNRQEEKDRERAKKDYMINLKSELEIRTLHDKIDHFIIEQQEELFKTQRVQIKMMTDILKTIKLNSNLNKQKSKPKLRE